MLCDETIGARELGAPVSLLHALEYAEQQKRDDHRRERQRVRTFLRRRLAKSGRYFATVVAPSAAPERMVNETRPSVIVLRGAARRGMTGARF